MAAAAWQPLVAICFGVLGSTYPETNQIFGFDLFRQITGRTKLPIITKEHALWTIGAPSSPVTIIRRALNTYALKLTLGATRKQRDRYAELVQGFWLVRGVRAVSGDQNHWSLTPAD